MKIIQIIKHTFWPGFNNSFHPYLVRVPALAFATSCLLLLQITVHVDGRTGDTLGVSRNITEEKVVRKTNQKRTAAGVEPLVYNERLSNAAENKARHMVKHGYWSHYGPDGTSPWNFIDDNGYAYQYVGENLAKSFQTVDGLISGWMNSSEHRENLLNSRYQDVGIATADGYVDGEFTTVVVALYGAPQTDVAFTADTATPDDKNLFPGTTTYTLIQPLNMLRSMPPVAVLGAVIALMLGMVYIAQHIVVRRRQLLWDTHIHPRPLLHAILLFGVVLVLVNMSYGVVG